jgi:hypothetical protein
VAAGLERDRRPRLERPRVRLSYDFKRLHSAMFFPDK